MNKGQANFEDKLRKDLDTYKRDRGIDSYKFDVTAIGVFDTVPAFGRNRHEDPDAHRLELYANHGYHAMSLDEQRNEFRLLRFGVPRKASQTLEEMWFPGVHADVGGGYGAKIRENIGKAEWNACFDGSVDPIGLEGISLNWMLRRFQKYELFSMEGLPQECVKARLHDEIFDGSWTWLYGAQGVFRRRPVSCDKVHWSVTERQAIDLLPVHNADREPNRHYDPLNLGENPKDLFCVRPENELIDNKSCLYVPHQCGRP